MAQRPVEKRPLQAPEVLLFSEPMSAQLHPTTCDSFEAALSASSGCSTVAVSGAGTASGAFLASRGSGLLAGAVSCATLPPQPIFRKQSSEREQRSNLKNIVQKKIYSNSLHKHLKFHRCFLLLK